MRFLNLLERALWTGVQAGLAVLTVEGLTSMDATPLELLSIAGVSAGLSALKTLAVERSAQIAVATAPAEVPVVVVEHR
jgi:hypothetical protein